MSQEILKMENITKSFPGVKALKGVDFSLQKGEVVSIIGENGAGKSTLMKILSGAYSHTTYQGRILIDGAEKVFSSPKDSENNGIGVIYQESNSFLDLSIAENIYIGNFFRKHGIIDWEKVNENAERLLKMLDMNIDPKTKMRELNGSELQMIAILKALSKNTKILILDEPTSSLTQGEVRKLFSNINRLKSENISCLFISHKLDEVFEISDRIVVMRDGEITGVFDKAQFNYDTIISCMIGRKLKEIFPASKHKIGDELLRVESFKVKHPYNKNENIVNDINFALRKGEILGLVGLVGAGRSELVNAIFGYGKKEAGNLLLEGKKITIRNPKDAVKYKIALVTEDRKKNGLVLIHSISKNMTLANLKKVVQKKFVIMRKKENELVDQYMKSLNVKANNSEILTVNLSGGNQQKVVLGKWLITDPKVLILDEPTRGIDIGSKVEIYNKIESFAESGMGIIIISSEFSELVGLCDRLLVLRQGTIQKELLRCDVDENKLMLAVSGAM